jgi:hypothetical protein
LTITPLASTWKFSVNRETDALRDAALDLAEYLRRVDHDAGVRGLDAVEDADLARDAVDGDAEAVGVGRDAARRPVRLARLGQPDTARASRLEELGQ